MGTTKIAILTKNLQSAIQAFQAGAVALCPSDSLSFEDLRKAKGLGLEILDSPYLRTLRACEVDYLDPVSDSTEFQILDCRAGDFTNVYWTVKYNALLQQGYNETDSTVCWAKDAMLVTSGPGLPVGTVERILSDKAVIRFSKPVALRDGLAIDDFRFTITNIDGGKSFISQNEMATINFPALGNFRKPVFGTPVYCTYRHNLGPEKADENISPYKRAIDISICIEDTSISINGIATEVQIQMSKSKADIAQTLRSIFSSSDRSLFILGNLEVRNQSSIEHPFLPMSTLKQIRRAFYETLDQAFLKG